MHFPAASIGISSNNKIVIRPRFQNAGITCKEYTATILVKFFCVWLLTKFFVDRKRRFFEEYIKCPWQVYCVALFYLQIGNFCKSNFVKNTRDFDVLYQTIFGNFFTFRFSSNCIKARKTFLHLSNIWLVVVGIKKWKI